jgi:fatty acid desaturase
MAQVPENNPSQQTDTKRKCPLAVILIACLFAATGTIGLVYHSSELNFHSLTQHGHFLVLLVRLLAIVGAVFLLFGQNWARWLLIIWLAYHVILSGFHSVSQVFIHSLLLIVIAWFLLRPRTSAYFRPAKTDAG